VDGGQIIGHPASVGSGQRVVAGTQIIGHQSSISNPRFQLTGYRRDASLVFGKPIEGPEKIRVQRLLAVDEFRVPLRAAIDPYLERADHPQLGQQIHQGLILGGALACSMS
jgi:hypothetical protein